MKMVLRRAWPVVLALAVAASVALGQDQPKDPVVVGRVSVASIDALNKFLADLGIPRSSNLDLKLGMESAPFLGAGSVATDKPVGMTVVAGDPHKMFPFEDSMLINVPVVAGKATSADQITAGGKAVEGTTDIFSVSGMGMLVRRTADYLHVKNGAAPFGLSVMNDAVFAADYKDATNLFVLTADMSTFRKAAPNAYKELAKEITALPRMFGISTPDDSKPVESVLDKVDRFTLALGQDDVNFHLKSMLAPSPVAAAAKEAARPAFPAGTMMRMHVVYPSPEAAGLVEKQLAALPEETFGLGMPPVYHQRMKDLVLKAASLNTRTEAVSIGVAMKGGKPVVYVVDQFNGDVDALKEIGEIAQEGVSMAAEGAGVKVTLDSSTYTAGDKKVQRLALTPEAGAAAAGGEKVVIDEIQAGRTLYVTIALNADEKCVADLANAGMDGKSSALCFGTVDLGAVLTAAIDAGGVPGMPVAQLQKLKASWAGQGVSWTVESAQNVLATDVQVSKQVVRDLVKMQTAPGPTAPEQTAQPGLP